MKKTIQCALVIGVFAINTILLSAQSNNLPEVDPNLPFKPASLGSTKALWDIEFDHDINAQVGSSGNAGCIYVNNEFWIAKWASDTLFRLNNTGNYLNTFTIAGLTGIRSMTFDGTYVHAANNTGTIYRIDPATATLAPPHINTTVTPTVRFATYDSTLNSNTGGFWVGNFNTDLIAIDLSGTQLSFIAAGVHNVTGMYGAAFDNYSAGGPYIWLHHQAGANNDQMTRVNIATGLSDVTHNVFPDISTSFSLTSSLAGGMFITDQLVPGEQTMVAVAQGAPVNVLIGYELNNPPASIDHSLQNSIKVYPNPCIETIKIELTTDQQHTYKIMDVYGRVALTGIVNLSNATIDITSLAKGTYLIQLSNSNQMVGSQTIIKN